VTCRFTVPIFVSFAFPSICFWRKSELLMCRFCGCCAMSGVWFGFSDFVTEQNVCSIAAVCRQPPFWNLLGWPSASSFQTHYFLFYSHSLVLFNRQRIKRSTSAVDSTVMTSETSCVASRLILQHVFQWHIYFMSNAPVAMLFYV